jgi:hypothetical protein
MRARLLALFLVAAPAFADTPVYDDCAVNPDRTCPVERVLPGLALIQGDPVVTGPDRLTFLAQDARGVVAVDLSLRDGSILRTLPLQLGEGDFQTGYGLIAQGGNGYLLHMWQGSTDLGLLSVSADGLPMELMRATWPEDWPLESSLAAALMLLAAQNVLAFDGVALQGQVYRFGLRMTASDGRLMIVELWPGIDENDTLGSYLERRLARQIDPVGFESVEFEGPLSAVSTLASDGSPSRLLLRSEDGGEIAFDQRLGDARRGHDYMAARVTADGRRLAAIRNSTYAGLDPAVRLMVFDTGTAAPLFEAPIPAAITPRAVWLPEGRIAVLQDREGKGVEVLILDPGT